MLEQDLVAGAGLDCSYKTGIRWIGGRWFRTGICWCRKGFAGPGLVVVVSAGAGKLSLVQDWLLLVSAGTGKVVAGSGLVVTGVYWRRKVVAGSGLVVAGVCWCRKVVAGSGLVVAGAELVVAATVKWLPMQEGSCWCRLKEY